MKRCHYCEEETYIHYHCHTCGNCGCPECRTHCPGCHCEMEEVDEFDNEIN